MQLRGTMKNGFCQCECHVGKKYKENLVEHHLAQRAEYPKFADDPDNLIYVCPSCHMNKIHDNGNFKKLSTYGENLRNQYLMKKGYVKPINGKTQSLIVSCLPSSPSVRSGSIENFSYIAIIVIFLCSLFSSWQTIGWTFWTIPLAILISLIIIGIIVGALFLLYKIGQILWDTGVKIYKHFCSR